MSIAIDPAPGAKLDTATPQRGFIPRLINFSLYLLSCVEVARQRRQLLSLDERTMKDTGIRPADISREIARSFWDIPDDQNAGR